METRPVPECICRSIFKNGESTISKERFTKIWIEMTNQIEKAKNNGWSEK